MALWQDMKEMIDEAQRSDQAKDLRTAVMATVCLFVCKRFGVRVEDVAMTRDKVHMRRSKTDELNEGASPAWRQKAESSPLRGSCRITLGSSG